MKNERPIDYQIPKKLFSSILETRSEEEKKKNPYSFVMDYINQTYNLRGKVTALQVIDI